MTVPTHRALIIESPISEEMGQPKGPDELHQRSYTRGDASWSDAPMPAGLRVVPIRAHLIVSSARFT